MTALVEPVAAFRRRCGWCGVTLRWWQINFCRRCKVSVESADGGPPCGHLSRLHAEPDRLLIEWK